VDEALRVGADFWESPMPEKPGCRQNQKASDVIFLLARKDE